MTCKECLHCEACTDMIEALGYTVGGDGFNAEKRCKCFTARSEWVHLPCKIGDNVYCIFENKVCIANVLAFYIDKVGIICELKISLNGELPTAPCSVCHIDRDSYTDNDICLTREEAEKALKGKTE